MLNKLLKISSCYAVECRIKALGSFKQLVILQIKSNNFFNSLRKAFESLRNQIQHWQLLKLDIIIKLRMNT